MGRRPGRVGLVSLVGVLLLPGAAAAQEAVTITVAQDGSGDHATIGEAIEAAADGDTILIAPGTYVEYLEIDKDLTISGQGDRADIVIEPPEEQDERAVHGMVGLVLIWSDGADITLEHFTLGPRFGYGIVLDGGTARISDISIPDTIVAFDGATLAIEGSDLHLLEFGGQSEVRVTDSILRNSAYLWEGATAVFEGNEVLDRPITADDGSAITVVGNTFRPADDEVGVSIFGPGSHGLITDNSFTGGFAGVILEFAGESLVEGNTFQGGELGAVAVETPSTISANTIQDVIDVGIVAAGHGMTVADNDISGGRLGIHAHAIDDGPPDAPRFEEPPRIIDNTVADVSHFALVIEDLSPSVSGNALCAGREAIRIVGDAQPSIGTNELCEP